MKQNETMRSVESNKREIYQNLENERSRLNSLLMETKESTLLIANDKIEKAKEDLLNRIRDLEKVENKKQQLFHLV